MYVSVQAQIAAEENETDSDKISLYVMLMLKFAIKPRIMCVSNHGAWSVQITVTLDAKTIVQP